MRVNVFLEVYRLKSKVEAATNANILRFAASALFISKCQDYSDVENAIYFDLNELENV